MLFQFLKQNKLYPVLFVINLIVSIFQTSYFQNGSMSLADEVIKLIITTVSYLYFAVIACGVVHFGVFCFYKYKEIDKNNVIAAHDKIEV
jgi:hypothetical protein